MKKHSCLLAVAALAVAGFSCQSCDFLKKGGGIADSTDVDTLAFTTVGYADTLRVEDNLISQSMKVDFPVPEAEGVLADSLRAYLREAIANHYFPSFTDSPDITPKDFVYTAGQEQEYLSACAGEGMTMMVDAVRSAAEDGWATGYENGYTASLLAQTDAYLTLAEGYYIYTGGAHGGYTATGVTFRRSDGRRMGWNLFDMTKKAQIAALIKEELRNYFASEEGTGPISEDQLMEELQLWDDPDTEENELEYGIPLPTSEPYVTRDGIAFVYQQYEIAAYACGLPCGTLPLEKVASVLSAEGRALLGLE